MHKTEPVPVPVSDPMTAETQFAPSLHPTVSSQHLDFGTLTHGARKTQTLVIGRTPVTPKDFSVTCDEEPTWFSIEKTEQVYPNEPFPLRIAIQVNADSLVPGRNYEHWIFVDMDGASTPVKLTVRLAAESSPAPVSQSPRRWRTMGIIVLSVMIILCTMAILTTATQTFSENGSVAPAGLMPTHPANVTPTAAAPMNGTTATGPSAPDIAHVAKEGRDDVNVPGWSAVTSPDGRQIVFIADQSGISQLYILNRETSTLRQLTKSSSQKSDPQWSPNGAQISFLADDGNAAGKQDLWLLDVKTQSQRRLTTVGCLDHAWSPTDNRLGYITSNETASGAAYLLWTVTPETDAELRGEVTAPHVSWTQ